MGNPDWNLLCSDLLIQIFKSCLDFSSKHFLLNNVRLVSKKWNENALIAMLEQGGILISIVENPITIPVPNDLLKLFLKSVSGVVLSAFNDNTTFFEYIDKYREQMSNFYLIRDVAGEYEDEEEKCYCHKCYIRKKIIQDEVNKHRYYYEQGSWEGDYQEGDYEEGPSWEDGHYE